MSEEMERRLILWRDYFQFLRAGLDPDESDKHNELKVWLNVLATECESDYMHRRQGQPQFCNWDELPKDLSANSLNI